MQADLMEGDKDNIVFVGEKETINYVLAGVTQLNLCGEVWIKARGRAISKAVDVSQIIVHKQVEGAVIAEVKLDTEDLLDKRVEGRRHKVSSIDILVQVRKPSL